MIEQKLKMEKDMLKEFHDDEDPVKWDLVLDQLQNTMNNRICKKKWETPNAFLFDIDQTNKHKIKNYSGKKNMLSDKEEVRG